jgi:hypothetical protein
VQGTHWIAISDAPRPEFLWLVKMQIRSAASVSCMFNYVLAKTCSEKRGVLAHWLYQYTTEI